MHAGYNEIANDTYEYMSIEKNLRSLLQNEDYANFSVILTV